MVLLFGYNAFDQILDKERYDHFRCLAFSSHLIESAKIDLSTHRYLQDLLEEFNIKFELLYRKEQAKSVIHALSHFANCIKNYEPAFRYSTFEFESTVASLTRLIHNENAPTIEFLRNLDLLKQTWLIMSDSSLRPDLKAFDQNINVHLDSLAPIVKKFVVESTNRRSYNLFKTMIYGRQRFSSDHVNIFRRTHDGCLLYKKNNLPIIGFLETVISFTNDDEPLLVIRPVNLISTADSMSINDRIYRCTNVLYGTHRGTTVEATNLQCIIQKLAFRPGTDVKFPPANNTMFFFQYPNRSGST
ncbi:unnamed protein product [Rotaria socialis]|uniref:Uncharacterized protein n=1 Tax=Rotaria socialis TaxID=392032 RepID=A0A818BJA8_9BILA|nr:unnamed protein product [Rotaria socialis]CAF4834576.1 unnamed protein product [Rotaria socialis]